MCFYSAKGTLVSYVALIIIGHFISLLSIDLLGSSNSAQPDTYGNLIQGVGREITIEILLFPEPSPELFPYTAF